MSQQDYENGVRKANKHLNTVERLFLPKPAKRLAQEKANRSLRKMFQGAEASKGIQRDFNKGMFMAYAYYAHSGRRLDERQII
jgi:hypothetical protein